MGASFLLSTFTGLYTWLVEPHWLEITQRKLSLSGLPKSLLGKTIAHISDIHIGPRVSDDFLIRSFAAVKALAPDLVVYTGDLTDYEPTILAHAKEMFSQLPLGKLGTFGVLGNHDYGHGWSDYELADELTSLAEKAGIRILRNETADLSGLRVIGLDDLWAQRFDLDAISLDSTLPSLILSHNPDTVDLPGWENFKGWVLAGHTHGGQCKPPFLPAPLLPVKNRRYTSGEFVLSNDRKMYISRGLGHLLQVRFNVRPEITIFELTES